MVPLLTCTKCVPRTIEETAMNERWQKNGPLLMVAKACTKCVPTSHFSYIMLETEKCLSPPLIPLLMVPLHAFNNLKIEFV